LSIELRKYLTRYWFEFEPTTKPTRWSSFGCGVTALDYDDAVRLLRERVFKGHELPPITRCVENVDVRTLDRGHVLPNMGVVIFRGVWWPHRDWVENHRF
jgi:hypothetical protein